MAISRWLAVIVFLGAHGVVAEEPTGLATMSYRDLCKAASVGSPDATMNDGDRIVFTVRSTSPEITGNDIKLRMNTDRFTYDVHVDETGQVALAYDQCMVDADATLVSNQPKGTLRLSMSFNVATAADHSINLDDDLLSGGRVSYAKLYDAARAKRASVARHTALSRMQAAGITAEANPSDPSIISEARVTVTDDLANPSVLLLFPSGDAKTAKASLDKSQSSIFSGTYLDAGTGVVSEPQLRKHPSGPYYLYCTDMLRRRDPDVVLGTDRQWMCVLLSVSELQEWDREKRRERLSSETLADERSGR